MDVKRLIQIMCNKSFSNMYNSALFLIKNRYICNIGNPETFNEKIQWRKKYQHDQRFPDLVDKWTVRDYIAKLYPEILVRTYGVFERAEDINFAKLPDQFIIKPTHGFGRVIICNGKDDFDEPVARKVMQEWLAYNQFYITGEWQYRDIKPRIIIDELLGENIKDYKFFCFDGEPYAIQIDSDRYVKHKRQLRDMGWNRIPCSLAYPDDKTDLETPDELPEMIDICRKLSQDFDFVRVDLFMVNEKIYFSELTFTPGNGMDRFLPKKYDYEFGRMWRIGEEKR